ncbi:solute carrier family 2, facilitated glucose transporter member 8-like [Anthonomus grandis grandis]|uniref:solute carrier family 2, facilitated glucose transporter member 8-like n=1 Tax=Anthonomus grandis grandis TaxID=2921223 RepID=UPI0021669EE8|nr:solute carrier family 2, facilitated glucose transporter member 8-like [Anthonomus grandis grandis]
MSGDYQHQNSRTPMVNEEKEPISTGSKRNQYLAGFAVCLGAFSGGNALSWTCPALEYLVPQEHNNLTNITNSTVLDEAPGFTLSTIEIATVGATVMLGGLIFAIPSGKFADIFGRKITLILISILYTANFITIAFARDVIALVTARFIAGLALGGSCVVGPMYIGEFAEESLRGVLGSGFNVLLSLGILYSTFIGIFTNWIWLNISLAIPSAITVVSLLFIPESPVYLIANERFGKARRSLEFFRGNENIVNDEMIEIQKTLAERDESATIKELFTEKCYRKSMIAGLGLFMYQQLCGVNIIVVYLVPIFRAAGSTMAPLAAASATNFIAALIGILSVVVINKRDRKYFLCLSGGNMMLGMLGLGVFFHLLHYNILFPGLGMLPIVCVVLFVAGFSIGMGPVPWILMIELYTPEIRGIANGVNIVSNWLTAFVVSFTFPYLMKYLGNVWSFYLYACINLLGVLFIWFVVPETRVRYKK